MAEMSFIRHFFLLPTWQSVHLSLSSVFEVLTEAVIKDVFFLGELELQSFQRKQRCVFLGPVIPGLHVGLCSLLSLTHCFSSKDHFVLTCSLNTSPKHLILPSFALYVQMCMDSKHFLSYRQESH
jgi:hypothetical protein